MTDLDPNLTSEDYQLDFTDVAVMVRSSSQMDLFKEALATYGVPFIVAGDKSDWDSQEELSPLIKRSQAKAAKAIYR